MSKYYNVYIFVIMYSLMNIYGSCSYIFYRYTVNKVITHLMSSEIFWVQWYEMRYQINYQIIECRNFCSVTNSNVSFVFELYIMSHASIEPLNLILNLLFVMLNLIDTVLFWTCLFYFVKKILHKASLYSVILNIFILQENLLVAKGCLETASFTSYDDE